MITVNFELCKRCGVCLKRFKGFCMSDDEGHPKIDYTICNQCQKCIAICPHQAIFMNGKTPEKISGPLKISPAELKELLKRRRSCKKFKDAAVSKEILLELANVAAYAPNQNKNIRIIIIDDSVLIAAIDRAAMKFTQRIYKILFSVKMLTRFYELFAKSLPVLKKKMEYTLNIEKQVVKENTQALFLAVGDPGVPVTENSAQYLLATMMIYAEALGLGSCLMDSFKLTINTDRVMKKRLGIPKGQKVLGVLLVGYPGENLVNIPQGYEVKVSWNGAKE